MAGDKCAGETPGWEAGSMMPARLSSPRAPPNGDQMPVLRQGLKIAAAGRTKRLLLYFKPGTGGGRAPWEVGGGASAATGVDDIVSRRRLPLPCVASGRCRRGWSTCSLPAPRRGWQAAGSRHRGVGRGAALWHEPVPLRRLPPRLAPSNMSTHAPGHTASPSAPHRNGYSSRRPYTRRWRSSTSLR